MLKWFNYLTIEPGPKTGANPAFWLHHRSLAKTSHNSKYLLANEWIAANIGWHIRLPIPPFAMMRKGGSSRYFASLDFSGRIGSPPDMNPERLAECLPDETTGVLLFDMFIANPDRHEGNLKVDNRNSPSTLEVFDHDQALFASRGVSRLRKVDGKLGYGLYQQNSQFHKLADAISTSKYFWKWTSRIGMINDGFIECICDEARVTGITSADAKECAVFLKHRKDQMEGLVRDNKAFFKKISDWNLVFA
jgi:hypothetical protein